MFRPIITFTHMRTSIHVVWVLVLAAAGGWAADIDFETLKGQAKVLAAHPYKDHRREVPRRLKALSYDDMQSVVFNQKKAVWRMERLPFQLNFFHPGYIQQDQVEIRLVDGDHVRPVPFSQDFFEYGERVKLGRLDTEEVRFAGFRILHPLNRPDRMDELAVFQGATYFRALPAGLRYGLSARAIAVNTAGSGPEEFPRFRDFWVYRPGPNDAKIRVLGLFDSPSVAGACDFTIQPGTSTVMETRICLFARTNIASYGIAPLTSMFLHGENSETRFGDFRPEVHDSDGILIRNGAGEWLWRPLSNGRQLTVASFSDRNPRGFGLLQRDRRYESYEDLEAMYHARPSAWVEPVGDWGAGAVRLVEIPSEEEIHDNVVAFWAPARTLAAGDAADFSYRLHWSDDEPARTPAGRTVSTRIGLLRDLATHQVKAARKYVLDFTRTPGGKPETKPPEGVVTAQGGRVADVVVMENPCAGTWRLFFHIWPEKPGAPVEMRAFLRQGGQPLTETWTSLWIP